MELLKYVNEKRHGFKTKTNLQFTFDPKRLGSTVIEWKVFTKSNVWLKDVHLLLQILNM